MQAAARPQALMEDILQTRLILLDALHSGAAPVQELDTAAPPPHHSCTDSKLHHQKKMAALISGYFDFIFVHLFAGRCAVLK